MKIAGQFKNATRRLLVSSSSNDEDASPTLGRKQVTWGNCKFTLVQKQFLRWGGGAYVQPRGIDNDHRANIYILLKLCRLYSG